MRIRRATTDDAEAVFHLHARTVREVCGRDYRPDGIESWLAKQSVERYRERLQQGVVWVAVTDEGEVLGFAARDGGRIKTLYVSADHQGEGIGSALLQWLEDEAAQEGLREVSARSTVTAVGFYCRMGYEVREQAPCPVTDGTPLAAYEVRKPLR